MTRPAPSMIQQNRLHDITAELRRRAPQWAMRLSQAETEQEFLQTICELFNLTNAVSPDRETLPDTEALSVKIRRFISDNIHRGVTLKLLSQFLGYSEKYCSDLFLSTMGESFSEYLKHQRLEKATFLLSTTDKSVVDIAAALGFSDQSAFSHFFKRATGHPPVRFRARRDLRQRHALEGHQ